MKPYDLKSCEAFIKHLEEVGVQFSYWAGNGMDNLSVEDLFEYVRDPVAYKAKYHGVSVEDFLEWEAFIDGRGDRQCRVIRKNNLRCKGTINLDHQTTHPAGYAKHPKLCSKHMEA